MKRSGPPDRKTPLKRTRINPVNRKRKRERYEAAYGEGGEYGAWIRSQPCVLAGTGACEGPIEAAHGKSRGAGGEASTLIPMCRLHHTVQHQVGRNSFRILTGIDLAAVAARLADEYGSRSAA